jgi:hypothetical protein
MKITILKNNLFTLWVDLKTHKDFKASFEISDFEAEKLEKGCEVKITKWVLEIIETEEYLEKEKQEKLKNLRNLFDEKLNKFLESYPKGIRETFTLRSDEANKFLNTWKSVYLKNLVKQKNIDRKKLWLEEIKVWDFASKILQKSTAFSSAYNQLESWYDLEKENINNN